MKCFEIKYSQLSPFHYYLLTVNMKCFEISSDIYNQLEIIEINRKHEMF